MRRRWLSLAVLGVALGSPSQGQAQRSTPYCWAGDVRTMALIDSLRGVAERLYPESVSAARHTDFVVVAIVTDAECRIIHRAIGTRRGRASADTVIARIIPDAARFRYSTSGFALLGKMSAADSARIAADTRNDIGLPWLVWGVAQVPTVR